MITISFQVYWLSQGEAGLTQEDHQLISGALDYKVGAATGPPQGAFRVVLLTRVILQSR